MNGREKIRVALVGNPNSGKTSLFNQLTGLNQKIGNYPGVTVDKKSGNCQINNSINAEILDLPGSYSIYPRSADERVVFETLFAEMHSEDPAIVIVITDAVNLKRNMLLFSQVRDMGLPVVLALNMIDVARKSGIKIDAREISMNFNVPVVEITARNGEGIDKLKQVLQQYKLIPVNTPQFIGYEKYPELIREIKKEFKINNDYRAWQLAVHDPASLISKTEREKLNALRLSYRLNANSSQAEETINRYGIINNSLDGAIVSSDENAKFTLSDRIDKILTHRIWGYLIFFIILFLVFQAIFSWAEYPMNLIDRSFSYLSIFLKDVLPEGMLSNLIVDGIIPGIGGILIFVPQIAILFAFVSLLEESGYMARVVYLMDKIMRKFGLNGRSIVPLISGVACAIPAIMATRSIDDWKDRLSTIFVAPLISCSARLPVYTILIALVVPSRHVLGFLNLQGLTLMGLYMLGFLAAILTALLVKILFKRKERSFLIMELPLYKVPRWKNVGLTLWEKSKTFVLVAGKIIIAISIILWVLANYGPGNKFKNAEAIVKSQPRMQNQSPVKIQREVAAFRLENSYAGVIGKFIEPVIHPLGFDWKMGIAIVSSFAAREIFVGTMATLYSIGGNIDDTATIRSRLKSETNPDTGLPVYTPAVAFSLIIYYVFAMQCMSTLAVVFKETKSIKWPLLQVVYMSGLAYLCSFVVYSILR